MNADKHLGRSDLPGNWYRYLIEGILAVVGTSGHVQTNHVGGDNTRVRVNESHGLVRLPGLSGGDQGLVSERAAAADVDVVNEVISTGTWDIYVDRVVYRHHETGAATFAFVKGTVAAHGSAVPPTNDEIQAAVGTTTPWLRCYRVLVYRSGDAAVSVTFDNRQRPLGVFRSTADGEELHTSEL